ncbi:hypothetical protein Desor_1474 [Desulfosporosinus orientis DSM 765]|uniref:Uncharacterized protein n=1 Tax=Desulfosporosinus orientis (strain ATCC 19365 / DSM 765 / NCIMB 8382 / VKM B-1628 / Singapore I) TaxID=768706 RepID=G7WAS0_DESOD|nr:hypothetical protein [Desulfosporosinus orientis]AET67131.1 hypothetical protein Desor_1474 [Desulfosporosinus orientis DSM 765]
MINNDYEHVQEWIAYRIQKLDQIEVKLMKMKQLAEFARDYKLSDKQIESINAKILNFQKEIIALDDQSKTFWSNAH